MSEIRVYSEVEKLYDALAQSILSLALAAVQAKGRFSFALAGGGTPRPLYARLGEPQLAEQFPWAKTHFFWGDERAVPPQDRASNYRMVQETLLQNVPVPPENCHRVPAELDPRLAAFNYEETLRLHFQGPWPQLDLVLLGMGEDGHTASLFPHSAGLFESQRWFIANQIPHQGDWRLTLTFPAINAASVVYILVSGEEKADRVREVLNGPYQPEENPVQSVRPQEGRLVWHLDHAAAQDYLERKR